MSWTIGGQGGKDKNPSWQKINCCLEKLNSKTGTVTLDTLSDNPDNVEMLQLRTDGGYYLITLSGINDNNEYQVRTLWNPAFDERKVNILGDEWPLKMLTKDFSCVTNIFKEFFETGNVSTEVLI